MPAIKDTFHQALGSLTKLSLVGGSLLWAWTRLKSDVARLSSDMGGVSRKVAGDVAEFGSQGAEYVSSTAQRAAKSAPKALKTVKKQKEAIMGKPKKKFSFLKFLLIMGTLIALAIFLLDKFLPKPYRDDELEDAWAGEDLEPADTDPARASEATHAEAQESEEEEDESEEDEKK